MNRIILILAGLTIAVVAIVAYNSVFTVDPTEQAIVLQFGAPREVVTQPGLHTKIPFTQMEYWRPFGANARRSGRPKVETPSPPNLVPRIVKRAALVLIARSRPSAGSAAVPYAFTERTISPSMQ